MHGTPQFKEINLNDKEWIKKHLAENDSYCSDMCFGNLFIWKNAYRHEVADYRGFLIIKSFIENQIVYYFPAGSGHLKQVISGLAAHCSNSGHPLVFKNITGKNKAVLEELFADRFCYTENRDASDYIYLRENLVTLTGRKYHGKRNHITRFMDNPDWAYEPVSDKNIDECYEMSSNWYKEHREIEKDELYQNEINAVRLAFEHFHELEFDGGLIRLNNSIVALTMGERLSHDTYIIHIEKALPYIQGAYAVINQQFAKRLPPEIIYINREDDLGDEGLRRSKLSYHPQMLLSKFDAVLKEGSL